MLKGEFLDIEVLRDHFESNDEKRTDISFAISPLDELLNVSFFIMTFTYTVARNINPEVYFKSRVTYRLRNVHKPLDEDLLMELVFAGYDRVKTEFKNIFKRSGFLASVGLPELTMPEFRVKLTEAVAEINFK